MEINNNHAAIIYGKNEIVVCYLGAKKKKAKQNKTICKLRDDACTVEEKFTRF